MRRDRATQPRAITILAVVSLALGSVILSLPATAGTGHSGLNVGNRFSPRTGAARTVAGDLCSGPVELGRNEMISVDLCQAWNDYDPGDAGCSPCALPGPEIVARLDTQAGERLRITTDLSSGSADVRVYLATDCSDPEGSCIAASASAGDSFEHVIDVGGELYLFIDTTGDCGSVQVWRPAPSAAQSTTFSALKAVYR
jgi:hypothetical protein